MAMQVHHVAQFDKDVAGEVTKWLKYLKGQVTSVQFLTTTVPDPKAPEVAGAVRGLHHVSAVALPGGGVPSAPSPWRCA